MNYYLVSVLDKFPVPMAVGLCLPEQCQLSEVEKFKPTLLKVIQAAVPNMIEEVKGFDKIDTGVTLDDLRIVEPKVENAKVTQITKGSIITMCIMGFFVVTGLCSTLIVWRKNQDEVYLEDDISSPDDLQLRPVLNTQTASFRFFSCFDWASNLSVLTKPLSKQGDEELEVLNFVRVFSCVMVIFGHSYFFMMKSPIQNLESV